MTPSLPPQSAHGQGIGAFLRALLATCFAFAASPARPESLTVLDTTGVIIREVATRTDDGVVSVPVSDLVALLDGKALPVALKYRYTAPTQSATLQFRDGEDVQTLRVRVGRATVAAGDGRTFLLEGEVREEEGRVWVPLGLVTDVLPKMVRLSATYRPESRRLVLGSADVAPELGAAEAPESRSPDEREPGMYRRTPAVPAVWDGLTVALDAGHGGQDTGVVMNGLSEKVLALDLATRIVRIARSVGAKALLTRSDDVFLSPSERAAIAEERGATVFVSVHFNSSFQPQASGYRIVVNSPEPAAVAPSAVRAGANVASQLAHVAATRKLAATLHAALSDAGFEGAEPLELPLAVIQRVKMPAVHIEMAYLSNATEAARWRDPEIPERAAEAIWSALARFQP
jgi:N-acetylmuramoyl-L-alanine amidase